MILIAEPVHFGAVHLQVNTAFVALTRHAFPDEEIILRAEGTHIAAIQAHGGDLISGVDFSSFAAYSRPGSRAYWPMKILGEWRQVIKTLLLARKHQPRMLIWLCLFPTGQWLLQWLSRLCFPKLEQIVVLHGEMEYLHATAKDKRSDRLLGKWLRSALQHAGRRMHFIVLGQGIPGRLAKAGVKIGGRLSALDHPFLYRRQCPRDAVVPAAPLRICTFGTLKRSKNAHFIYDLAARFREEVAQGRICFSTVGQLFEGVHSGDEALVRHDGGDHFLPQVTYEQLLAGNDLAVFFYDRDMYRFSASGVIHEAFNAGLPVLSLYNDYFADLLQRYPAGVCCNDIEELVQVIRGLLQDNTGQGIVQFSPQMIVFFDENAFLLQSERLKLILCEGLA